MTGHSGWIKWHDISTGEFIAGFGTGHGPCRVLTHNPTNAVSHAGHSNGVVTLWSPAAGKPLASMFCHKAPLTDIAVDREGRYMVTAGLDGYLKVQYPCHHRCSILLAMHAPVNALLFSAL
jgi:U3 small nucleolar RNA-associated protein 7